MKERLIRWKEMREMIGGISSRSTVDRWEKSGEFPQRVRLGKNSIAWNLDDINEWIVSRITN